MTAAIPDLDGDAAPELVSWQFISNGRRGSITISFLDGSGRIKRQKTIDPFEDGFGRALNLGAEFGASATVLDDLDGDGILDLAVGAPGRMNASQREAGSVWILFLNETGTVEDAVEIRDLNDNFPYPLDGRTTQDPQGDRFGEIMTTIDDLDGDGVKELVVGAPGDDDGGFNAGAFYIIHSSNFPRRSHLKLDIAGIQPDRPRVGDDVAVTIYTPGTEEPADLTLSFRWGGYPGAFLGVAMDAIGGGSYTAHVPSPLVTERGIEYYVSGTGAEGRAARFPLNGVASVSVFVETGLPLTLHGGDLEEAYRLYSIPLSLDEASARAALEPQLGPYDISQWRFFGYERGQGLSELSEQDIELAPGHAYWMLTRELDQIVNPGPGTTVPTDRPYLVGLTRGPNLVGNPFVFPIPLSNLRTTGQQSVDLYTYDGAWEPANEGLQPFEGYVLLSDRTDTLLIDPDLTPPTVEASQSNIESRASNLEHLSQLEALFPFTKSGPVVSESLLTVRTYPNPFFDTIAIEFDLRETAEVTVEIYDILGRRLARLVDGETYSGKHSVQWDGQALFGSTLADGPYFYRLVTDDVEHAGLIFKAH